MGVEDSTAAANDLSSHKTKKNSNSFSNAVLRLGMSGVIPCRRPCTGIKLLEIIDRRRVGCNGLFRRKHVLNNVQANAETLITYVEDHQREQLESLVKTPIEKYLLTQKIMKSTGFTSAFHLVFLLQDVDLASVGLKATSDKSWSLSFNHGQISKKSVAHMALIDILDQHDTQRLRSVKRNTRLVSAIYSVLGGLTYTGDFRLVTTGGMQLGPTQTGPVMIMAGCQYKVTNSGQVVLCETDPVEWIIAIEFLELKDIYKQKRQSILPTKWGQ